MSSEKELEKIHFEPSTIETIDRSVYQFVKNLNLQVDTNKGVTTVPVLWGTSERSFLSKNAPDSRDIQGALIFPAISIKRSSFTKPAASPGVFIGNLPENYGSEGGTFEVSRVINEVKSRNFANATAKKLTGQESYPIDNKKKVYKILSIPMPVNVELSYQITLRTEYQQQINDLILPFITTPGTVRAIRLEFGDHKYEGFIQPQFQSQDNLSSFEGDARKFEMSVDIRVVGYLVGHGNSREKPFISIRENVVEVKLPRERAMLDEEEIKKYNL
jgi:hypothetical protein